MFREYNSSVHCVQWFSTSGIQMLAHTPEFFHWILQFAISGTYIHSHPEQVCLMEMGRPSLSFLNEGGSRKTQSSTRRLLDGTLSTGNALGE